MSDPAYRTLEFQFIADTDDELACIGIILDAFDTFGFNTKERKRILSYLMGREPDDQ